MVAGRYRKICRYPRSLPGDDIPDRARKHQSTQAAQRFINIANCTERLQWSLVCNYDCKHAAFVTFDFADDYLPDSRKGVQARVKGLISKMRKTFAAQGREFPVIYMVEGQPGPGLPNANTDWEITPWTDEQRWAALDPEADLHLDDPVHRLHAHGFMVLPTAEDRALVRSFWPYGKVYINYIRINDFTSFVRLAWYCTKESRNGTRPAGERSYIPSLHLKKPESFGRWAEEGEEIAIPASIPTSDRLWDVDKVDYLSGLQCHQIAYRYPRDNPAAPKSYQSKGRISDRAKSAKTQ